MYLEFFGLTDPPFRITPNTEYWFAGGQRGDVLTALEYAIAHGEGLIKVVAEVGSGKTMLCRMLQQRLTDNIDSVYLGNPTLTPDEILVAILTDLGIRQPAIGDRQALLDQLNNALLSRHSAGRRVVAFVEEAQGISLESLEFLRLLTNLETASDKLLQIVLFGQPELDQILSDPRIRQIKDRITLSLTLPPLSAAETGAYLRSRLHTAGYRGPDLFSAAVVARIAKLSKGLSRRINILADKSLLAAFAGHTHNVRPAHVVAAAEDAELTPSRAARLALPSWAWAVVGMMAGVSLLALISWRDSETNVAPDQITARLENAVAPTSPRLAPAASEQRSAVSILPRAESLSWIKSAPAHTFVIQIVAAKDEREASTALSGSHRQLPQPLRGFRAHTANGPAWLIIAGEYPDRSSALAALTRLPADIRAKSPFLRTVGKIRAVLAHEDIDENAIRHS